ncbi:MAG: hypothetical protein WCV85_00595 [Patescibacteria group bacterium]|jgi:hypothetical protein
MKKVLIGLMLVLLAFPLTAQACSCIPPSAQESYKDADVIFAGKVTKVIYVDDSTGIGCDEPRTIVHFQVGAYWKGNARVSMTLHTVENRCSCDGYDFIEGETYLVYAYEETAAGWGTKDGAQLSLPDDGRLNPDDKILGTSYCSRTSPLLWRLKDVAIFGKPKEPQQ